MNPLGSAGPVRWIASVVGVCVLGIVLWLPGGTRESGTAIGVFDIEQYKIRVTSVVNGLSHPWSLAFLPNGDLLVTERAGRLRLIRKGVLQKESIPGVPAVRESAQEGLLDIAIHPRFSENRFVYLTYSRRGDRGTTVALARGRFDGTRLADTRDIFVADAWSGIEGNMGSRMAFSADGTLFMTAGERHKRTPSPGTPSSPPSLEFARRFA